MYRHSYICLLVLIHTSHPIVSMYTSYIISGYLSYLLNIDSQMQAYTFCSIYIDKCKATNDISTLMPIQSPKPKAQSPKANGSPFPSCRQICMKMDAQCQMQKRWNERKPGPLSYHIIVIIIMSKPLPLGKAIEKGKEIRQRRRKA